MAHTSLDLAWVALTSALVFIMQGGFALLESGLTRSKNSINVAVKNLTDLGISLLCFWLVGFGLMFGASSFGLTGIDKFFFSAAGAWPGIFFLFQAMFCSTSATIVSGAVAERMKYGAYIVATILMSVVIYPIAGHWAWGGALEGQPSGWLGARGFVDFAGSTVVHSVGGWVSLAALLVIGPRHGRYDNEGVPHAFSGSSIPLAVTGTMLLWFGWFGFNGGSTLAVNDAVPVILVNTSLAAAAGMIGCLAVGWTLKKVPDVSFIINGSLGGLVAITASCHAVSFPQALLIGAVGGALTLPGQALLDKLKIDDAVGAIPVHLGAGIWGTLCVGLFGDPSLLNTGLDRGSQILMQLTGIGAIGLFSFGVAILFFALYNRFFALRVTVEDEASGLNVAEHGATTEAYGLFQTLEQQARTGDLSLRAPADPFTEVGQIATQYNRVLSNLEENVVAKSEYLNILDSLNEGLFLIDGKGTIGPFYSAALEQILQTENLAGQTVEDALRPLTSPSVLESWSDFLGVLFDHGVDDPVVQRLNPLRHVDLTSGLGTGGLPRDRNAQFQFRRIVEEDRVVRAMVIVRDVTEETRLKKTLESQHQDRASEMELFYKLLHVDPSLLAEFLAAFQERTGQINRLMETGQNAPKEVLKQTFRLLHSIKGEAALLDLEFVAEEAHRLEEMVQHLQKQNVVENSDFLGFALKFGDFQEIGDRMSAMVGRLTGFQRSYLQAEAAPDALTVHLGTLVHRTAETRGKKAELKAERFHVELLAPRASVWKDILVQLVRNGVVHGIETPARREGLHKPVMGRLEIASRRVLGGVEVSVRDDGSGLDLVALRRKAVEAGWQDYQLDKWTKTDWVRFLFTDGVSTAARADLDAGRGVGLSLVGRLVKEAGGKIGIKFETNHHLEVQVTLPDPRKGA